MSKRGGGGGGGRSGGERVRGRARPPPEAETFFYVKLNVEPPPHMPKIYDPLYSKDYYFRPPSRSSKKKDK